MVGNKPMRLSKLLFALVLVLGAIYLLPPDTISATIVVALAGYFLADILED